MQYIRIGDFTDIVEECVNSVNAGERSSEDIDKVLSQIEAAKSNLQAQIKVLMELRRALFQRYLKR